MYNFFRYITSWSLLINASIFIWAFIIKVPTWLFLFAACLLTITSILGTFFLTLPKVDDTVVKHETSRSAVILTDAFIHVIPLIIFLVIFNYFPKRLRPEVNLGKTFFLLFILFLIYGCYIEFEHQYDFDKFSLGVLSLTIFFSSYNVYCSLLSKN